jgi:hypothetical protein
MMVNVDGTAVDIASDLPILRGLTAVAVEYLMKMATPKSTVIVLYSHRVRMTAAEAAGSIAVGSIAAETAACMMVRVEMLFTADERTI